MDRIQKQLFALQDLKYKDFQCKLMPTVSPDSVIGVRTPMLRELGKSLRGSAEASAFLSRLPHTYYEENNLHAYLISSLTSFDECIAALDRFLPFVDNWATCDMMRPACFKKSAPLLLPHIERWLLSSHVYTVRFGIEMLMVFFLDQHFDASLLARVAKIQSDEYYLKMMQAWYFATALAKQWEAAVPYIEARLLSPWVHAKTIQKAIESYRIADEQKQYLRSLK